MIGGASGCGLYPWSSSMEPMVVELLDELSNYSRRRLGSVVFSRCHSSCLKLRLFVKSKDRTSRWDFVSQTATSRQY